MSCDETTVEKYKRLFPAIHNPNMPYVTFQQVILKDKLSTATGEELRTIQEFVDNRFGKDTALCKRLWEDEEKAGDPQSSVDLERKYVNR